MKLTQKQTPHSHILSAHSLLLGIIVGFAIGHWQLAQHTSLDAWTNHPSLTQNVAARRLARTQKITARPAQFTYTVMATRDMHPAASTELVQTLNFPAFDHTTFPVNKTPDWGSMRSAAEWDRSFGEMLPSDFVSVPAYRMSELLTPLEDLVQNRTSENNRLITTKLFYSTRFFGAYDLDSPEFVAVHPGLDLKLAPGTPIAAIAGGRVEQVITEKDDLGLHLIIEHHINGEKFYSIYGHLSVVAVRAGQDVGAGEIIGSVGSSGFSTAPHLHLQIDKDNGTSPHDVYWPSSVPSPSEAALHVVNPVTFILEHANGN